MLKALKDCAAALVVVVAVFSVLAILVGCATAVWMDILS